MREFQFFSLDGQIKPGTCSEFQKLKSFIAILESLFLISTCLFTNVVLTNGGLFLCCVMHLGSCFVLWHAVCLLGLFVYDGCSWKHLAESALVITAVQHIQPVLITDAFLKVLSCTK